VQAKHDTVGGLGGMRHNAMILEKYREKKR
jgi:hypothetical protein